MGILTEIRSEIEAAFLGVVLDGGVSLRQTRFIDNYMRGITESEFRALPATEVTDDWTRIPIYDLESAGCIAFLDAKGFKYYIPALMLALLYNYQSGSMAVIATLSSLYPKEKSREVLYSELTEIQRKAIAKYMRELPTLVDLWGEDKTVVERSYRNFWSKYLES